MSHSTVAVVLNEIPTDDAHLDGLLAKALAPFDEGRDVQPYPHEANDVQVALAYDEPTFMRKREESGEALREWITKILADTPKDELLAAMIAREREQEGDDEFLIHQDKICYMSTYNPNSKWDWYVIGGRWDGLWGGRNHMKAEDFKALDPDQRHTFAFLDHNGEWDERGSMGWFGCVADEKPEVDWDRTHDELVNAIPDDAYVVLVDVHI